jgi:hypothetical protein
VTQFFEFATRIADESSDGDTVRVPPVLIQPMAADDVPTAVCNITLAALLNNTMRSAGPNRCRSRTSSDKRCAPWRISVSWSPILKLGTSAPN